LPINKIWHDNGTKGNLNSVSQVSPHSSGDRAKVS
jgi:hypothetical protein